jgi:hypothetical protein
MQRRRLRRSTRQDETPERRKLRVHRIDLALQPLNLRRNDPQHHLRRCKPALTSRRSEIGAKIEQVVLDPLQRRCQWMLPQRDDRHANRRIRLVDIADRLHQRARLRHAGAIDQPRPTVIPGPRINRVELDHLLLAPEVRHSDECVSTPTGHLPVRRSRPVTPANAGVSLVARNARLTPL